MFYRKALQCNYLSQHQEQPSAFHQPHEKCHLRLKDTKCAKNINSARERSVNNRFRKQSPQNLHGERLRDAKANPEINRFSSLPWLSLGHLLSEGLEHKTCPV